MGPNPCPLFPCLIALIELSGDVTFGRARRTTGNEAGAHNNSAAINMTRRGSHVVKERLANRCMLPPIPYLNLFFYILDRSVLLENTPRVRFIRNYIRDPSGVFSISYDVIFRIFTVVCANSRRKMARNQENNELMVETTEGHQENGELMVETTKHLVSEEEEKKKELRHIQDALLGNDYKRWMFKSTTPTTSHKNDTRGRRKGGLRPPLPEFWEVKKQCAKKYVIKTN